MAEAELSYQVLPIAYNAQKKEEFPTINEYQLINLYLSTNKLPKIITRLPVKPLYLRSPNKYPLCQCVQVLPFSLVHSHGQE